MEAANTIYGISMGEEGVSKVISLQLDQQMEKKEQAYQ
jgi:chromosome segregation ATPase